jgi:hypothetical protein
MGVASITHRSYEKCIQYLFVIPEGKRPLAVIGVDGRVILKWILGSGV